MSEGQKYLKIDEKTRTIETQEGDRFVFSNKAFGALGCTASDLEKGINDKEEFQKLRKMIFCGGNYKIEVRADDKGNYTYIRARGESQQLKIISLDSADETNKCFRMIAGEKRDALIEKKEKEETSESIDLAVNLYEGVSQRKTNNKDTKEIDINAIMQQTRNLGKEIKRQ
ncbi:MAG: hypothetical protein QW666_02935 [Candidatus Woesearchaeota archaeon]